MASSSNLTSVIISDSDTETPKMQDVTSLLQKEVYGENLNFRSLSSPHSQQTINDGILPSPLIEIPQWKKDLIQRRKTNVAKTIAANQCFSVSANSSKAYKTSASSASSSPTSDLKNSLNFPNSNNICEKSSIHASNVNTICDSKMNSSHHSFGSALNVNNMYKTPATIQQDEIESSCGGHHTQVNNKPSGGSYNYSEKLSARTVSVIQQEQTQTVGLVSQSLSVVEQNSNESNPTLAQENVKFQKNLTEQHETTNTTSSDSVKISTSRLSTSLKVAAAAENYKKSNKGHLNVCVSEQATHILQEPALTTNVSNKNGNGGCGCDDEQQLHHQLKAEHESDSLVCADSNVKESDQKLLSINNNANGIITLSPKVVLNKKPCGITSTSVRSSPILSSSQFVKNQNIGNATLVSSYHNHKINTKYRLNQNSGFSSNNSTTSSVIESPTTVTNNKKKMVAVQEMNEIANNELDFDPSEELQYGPGIVSKLRCRYLSLALRQSVSKQRLSMDTLRRATSLNNLLDNSDVHDEDDEDDEDGNSMQTRNKEASIPTLASISQIETKEMSIQLKEPTVNFEKNIKNYADERITSGSLACSHHHRSRHIKRGNDSLKRARSVEALLCEKSPWNFAINQPVILSNNSTESVSIEDKINNARDRLLSGTDNPPKRLTSIIDDTERPPPDLVKQTLKIFEASANRKGRSLNRNSGGEVATKIANYKSIITQNKPAIAYPKPPISPKKTDLKKTPNEATKISLSSPTTPTANQSIQVENNLLPVCSTPAVSSRTTAAFRQKMDLTPIRNVGCVGSDEGLSENSPDIIPRHKLLDKVLPIIAVVDSPVTELTKKIEKLRIESPVTIQTQHQAVRKEFENRLSVESSDRDSHDDDDENEDDDDDDDSIDGVYEVNKEECDSAKQITKCALENIAKPGTSKRFQYKTKSSPLANGNSLVKLSDPLHDIPNLPSLGPTTVKQIGVIRPILAEPQHVENSPFLEVVGENSAIQGTSTLTSREIEKNRINNEKKIEVQGNYCSMDEVGCIGFAKGKKTISITTKNENNETVQTPAWSSAIINKKKRNPATSAPENNTMVFNFKDRKEVPDYIDNDGLNFKRKRELPKPNESGFVLLGDLSLETSTDPEDEWPMCPPSPCDVEFENANIIIDGKSSIKNRSKDAHFRVQFNDTLTSTFEYPSESSVIEDSGSEYADDLSLNVLSASSSSAPSKQTSHETDSSNIHHHHHVTVEEIIQLPHSNKVLGNLSLGSAPLGSYTPVKATTDNIFQLGVTRIPNSQAKKNSEQFSSKESLLGDYYKELENSSLEYLKPASDDLTIAYSEGSLKTDLLY